eukprot:6457107-Amphidinium_carterae.1
MHDQNRAKWLPWAKYTKQQQEIMADKGDPMVVLDQTSGTLKPKNGLALMEADLSSDLLVYLALVRRGLALDQAGLVSYDVHSLWLEEMFEHRLAPAARGHTKTTLDQMQEADKLFWYKLSEQCTDGIRVMSDGTAPMEVVFKNLIYNNEVQSRLSQLQSSAASASEPPPATSLGLPPLQRKRPQQGQTGKAAGKKQQKTMQPNMPAGLQGGVSQLPDGSPICFAYNLGTCPYKPDPTTNKCVRGKHVCCAKGCGGSHTFREHR